MEFVGKGGGLMAPLSVPIEVSEYDFTNERLEVVYSESDLPTLLIVQPLLPDAVRRARELEAHGYHKGAAMLPHGGTLLFMYAAEAPDEISPETVAAIRSVIAEMEPEWVAAVAEARRYADCPRIMAAWCEIPLQAVMAALDVLKARGRRGA